MKKGAIFLIIVFMVLSLAGCSSEKIYKPSDSELREMALTQDEAREINAELSTLSERDLYPKNEVGVEERQKNSIIKSGYLKFFDNSQTVGGDYAEGYRRIFIAIYVLDSIEDAQKTMQKGQPGFRTLNLREQIGDESYAYYGTYNDKNLIIIWLRKGNIVGKVESEGSDSTEAINYAKMLESKIK